MPQKCSGWDGRKAGPQLHQPVDDTQTAAARAAARAVLLARLLPQSAGKEKEVVPWSAEESTES
jgi:hypothetical protein